MATERKKTDNTVSNSQEIALLDCRGNATVWKNTVWKRTIWKNSLEIYSLKKTLWKIQNYKIEIFIHRRFPNQIAMATVPSVRGVGCDSSFPRNGENTERCVM